MEAMLFLRYKPLEVLAPPESLFSTQKSNVEDSKRVRLLMKDMLGNQKQAWLKPLNLIHIVFAFVDFSWKASKSAWGRVALKVNKQEDDAYSTN